MQRTPWIALAVAVLVASSGADTLHVDASNPACPGAGTAADPFCTIADALAAANPGDAIEVAPGSYAGSLVVAVDGVVLRGAGAPLCTLAGDPGQPALLVAPGAGIADFTLEGFRVLPGAPGLDAAGLVLSAGHGGVSRVAGCRIEGHGTGIDWGGAGELVLEDSLVAGSKGDAVLAEGVQATITRSTIAGNGQRGIVGLGGGPFATNLSVRGSVLAFNGWWAVERFFETGTLVEHDLAFANNLANPPFAPTAGPFMTAAPFAGYFPFGTGPGPVLAVDPLFVDASAGDWRPRPGSPAIDAGVPGAAPAPGAFDVEGYGHPRLLDGNFDGAAQLDLGAFEFGGLQAHGSPQVAASPIVLELSGPPGSLYELDLGLPAGPLSLGPLGALFLDPTSLLPVSLGSMPATGTAPALSALPPPALAGLALHFQGGTLSPAGAGRLTNLERVEVLP